MRCERGIEKSGMTNCSGGFCQPDGFDAVRIANNFPVTELSKNNQLYQALKMKGVFN